MSDQLSRRAPATATSIRDELVAWLDELDQDARPLGGAPAPSMVTGRHLAVSSPVPDAGTSMPPVTTDPAARPSERPASTVPRRRTVRAPLAADGPVTSHDDTPTMEEIHDLLSRPYLPRMWEPPLPETGAPVTWEPARAKPAAAMEPAVVVEPTALTEPTDSGETPRAVAESAGAATRRRRRASRRRRRMSPITAFAVAIAVVGLGMLSGFAWKYFGTSVIADRQANQAVADFDATVTRRAVPAQLHTDFDAFPVPEVSTDGTWGLLIVPSWQGREGLYGDRSESRMPIAEGTGPQVLDKAYAGHYTQTALPGQVGNMGLAGHRRTYGNNFLYADKLEPGDPIVIETREAWFVYKVTDQEIVTPDNWEAVAPVPGDPDAVPTKRLISLTTCHSLTNGAWGNDRRLIVHGELVGWVEHDAGIPEVVLDATASLEPPMLGASPS